MEDKDKTLTMIKSLISELNLNCTIDQFKSKYQYNWQYICACYKLSENFIREYQNDVDWDLISKYQNLSKNFIREFQDKVNWSMVSLNQELSEKFIVEFQDKVYWPHISDHQKLSENFIMKFKDRLDWYYIFRCQKLSEPFIDKLLNLDQQIEIYLKTCNHRTRKDRIKDMRIYADKFNLKFDGEYLYAFRNHGMLILRQGYYNRNILYNKNNSYYIKDSHGDLNADSENPFGLVIWCEGDIAIKVHVDDWIYCILDNIKGKARVWAFTII